jgi:acetylornithine/succinyldiaminopimelate/putrescine aminotransferase
MKTSLKEFRQYVAQVGEIDPIMIDVEKAEGIWVWDTDGKKYIDMLSGICVGNVGHRNQRIVEKVKQQLDKYMHIMVYGEFVQSPQLNYAKRLMSVLPNNFNQIFYVNSGSEAIEGAIKAARLYNNRHEVISFKNSYHGSTLGAVSLLSDEKLTQKFRPLIPMCNRIEFNNEDDLLKITEKTSCVVAETIQAGAGVILPKNDFLKKLKAKCQEVGALLIMDEIQTGFGRTGKLFGFMNYGFVPDILCIAKGMGAGMPIGAFVSSNEIMNKLNNHHPLIGHATTFGGHPISCVAALENLNIIIEENLMDEVEAKGEIYRTKLIHPQIKEVRGIGLFNCIELKHKENWQKALISCFEQGIITGTHLFNEGCLSIKPPLTITYDQINLSIEKILKALDALN